MLDRRIQLSPPLTRHTFLISIQNLLQHSVCKVPKSCSILRFNIHHIIQITIIILPYLGAFSTPSQPNTLPLPCCIKTARYQRLTRRSATLTPADPRSPQPSTCVAFSAPFTRAIVAALLSQGTGLQIIGISAGFLKIGLWT